MTVAKNSQQRQKDLEFLREMQARLDKGCNADPTQLDYVSQMIADWIDELEG